MRYYYLPLKWILNGSIRIVLSDEVISFMFYFDVKWTIPDLFLPAESIAIGPGSQF